MSKVRKGIYPSRMEEEFIKDFAEYISIVLFLSFVFLR